MAFDVFTSDRPVCIAVRQQQLSILDFCTSHHITRTSFISCMDPVLTCDVENSPHLVYIAEGNEVLTFDTSKLPALSQQQHSLNFNRSSSSLSLVMGGNTKRSNSICNCNSSSTRVLLIVIL